MASRATKRLGTIGHRHLQGFYLDRLLDLETGDQRSTGCSQQQYRLKRHRTRPGQELSSCCHLCARATLEAQSETRRSAIQPPGVENSQD
jgi:hypothetical protein